MIDNVKECWRIGPVIVMLAQSILVGCATVPGAEPTEPAESAETGDNYEYTIGPGDVLDIFVWGYEDLSVSLPVRPDGKITTRLVEDLEASGKSPTELAREIEKAYRQYVKNPTVTVSINEFVGSPAQQVKVVGGGTEPRTVPFQNDMSVLDVMITVGGLGEFSSGNRSVLVRTVNGEKQSFNLRLDDLIRKGDIGADVPLQPGDIIIIPESWF